MRGEGVSEKKKWDLTSTGGLWSAAEWIRKSGDALLVVALRADDMAFSVADGLLPKDAVAMLEAELPALLVMLQQQRDAKKGARSVGSRSGEATR
jgi:hypothetical protein